MNESLKMVFNHRVTIREAERNKQVSKLNFPVILAHYSDLLKLVVNIYTLVRLMNC